MQSTDTSPSLWTLIKYRIQAIWRLLVESHFLHLPVTQNDGTWLKSNTTATSVTYIGHATVLIQINGLNILTDPMFSDRVGLLVRRYSLSGIDWNNLPKIDLVLLSHAHPDHLDFPTLDRLDHNTPIICEKTIAPLIKHLPHNIIPFHLGETLSFQSLKIHTFAVRHWGARYIFDRYRKCNGFLLEGNHTIYFPGDTAYYDGFAKTGKEFDIDIALLPIGDYIPRKYRHFVHMSPFEAVQAASELKAKISIPIHWGVFKTSYDDMDKPLEDLQIALTHAKEKPVFHVLRHGETKIVNEEREV